MRIVATAKNDEGVTLESVLTARVTSAQFTQLGPAGRAEAVSSPGPAKLVRVRLSSGHAAVVVFHERHGFMEILAPILAPRLESGLADLLRAIGLAPDAITWTDDRVDRQAIAWHDESVPAPVA